MFNWKGRKYVNERKRVFKNLDTGEILNLEIQDDPDNIIEESDTPLSPHCLNIAQQELVDDITEIIEKTEEDFTNQITMTSSSYVFDGFLKKIDKLMVLQGRITKSFFARDSLDVCMKIPTELAPERNVSTGILLNDAGALGQVGNVYKTGNIDISSNGNVSVFNTNNGMKVAPFSISWYVG